MRITRFSVAATLVLAAVYLPACRSDEPAAPEDPAAAVKQATQPFLDLQTAIAQGYDDQWPAGCAESPDGAQGFHFRNPDLVDATVDLLHPEILMYEPQADSSMELIGVDYIVPFELWEGDAPPTLAGQEMGRNEPLGVWAIHIWAWRDNPSGVFAPWNPTVSCAHAAS